ncbi:hypothetical protein DICA2_E06084 [Diutina catenulata]
MGEDGDRKRRRRMALSCDNCRAKKTKCDRQLPCARCVKKMMPHLCVYSSPTHVNNTSTLVIPSESNEFQPVGEVSELVQLRARVRELESALEAAPQAPGYMVSGDPVMPGSNQNLSPHYGGRMPPFPHGSVPFVENSRSTPSVAPLRPTPGVRVGSTGYVPPIHQQNSQPPRLVPKKPSMPRRDGPNPPPAISTRQESIKLDDVVPPDDGNIVFDSDATVRHNYLDLLVGQNPVDDANALVSFFFTNVPPATGEEATLIPNRSFPFLVLTKRDPGLALFYLYELRTTRNSEYSDIFFYGFDKATNRTLQRIDHAARQIYGDRYIKQLEDGYSLQEVKDSLSRWGERAGLSFMPGLPHAQESSSEFEPSHPEGGFTTLPETSLNCRLHQVFKAMAPLTDYFDVFFSSLYGFFPIVDENDVRRTHGVILGDGQGPLNLKSSSSAANVAMWIYIAALTYSSLLSLDLESNVPENYPEGPRRSVMSHPVPVEAIMLAEECLNRYNFMRKQNLEVLQACIFSHILGQFYPIMGDSLVDSQSEMSLGVLMHMAYSLGLHRDPLYINPAMPEPLKNLRRKIWLILVQLDLTDTMVMGSTVAIGKGMFDTKLPTWTPENANLAPNNHAFEKSLLKFFYQSRPVVIDLTDLCLEINPIRPNITLARLSELLSDTEIAMSRLFGRYSDFVHGNYLTKDTAEFFGLVIGQDFYVRTKLFLAVLYFRLYIYFNDTGNVDLEFFYLKKVYTLIFIELGEFAQHAIGVARISGGRAGLAPIVSAPQLNRYLHMSSMILASLACRLAITSTDHDPELAHEVVRVRELVRRVLGDVYRKKQLCGNQFFTSWRHKKVTLYFLRLLTEPDFFNVDDDMRQRAQCHFSASQLREIGGIISQYAATNNLDYLPATKTDMLAFTDLLMDDSNSNGDSIHLSPQDEHEIATELQVENFWRQLRNIFTQYGTSLFPMYGNNSGNSAPGTTQPQQDELSHLDDDMNPAYTFGMPNFSFFDTINLRSNPLGDVLHDEVF